MGQKDEEGETVGRRQDESAERYKKAKELVAGGMTVHKAINQVGMGSATWYAREKAGGETKLRAVSKKKKPGYVDLHREPVTVTTKNDSTVALVICLPDQIQNILRSLK